MKMIRAFFAVMPHPATHALFSNFIESLKEKLPERYIFWVDIEKLHVTLKFVQSIEEEKIPSLVEKLKKELLSISKFSLEFDGLEWFPSADNPKILSLAVGPMDILSRLSSKITDSMGEFTQLTDTLSFRPHMTLGRLDRNAFLHEDLSKIPLSGLPEIEIKKIYLMESKFYKGNTHYIPVATFDLS